MSTESKLYRDAFAVPGYDADRRAEIEHQQRERAAERQEQIALQSSLSDPEERIQLWEKLHALRLPRSATHQLVRVIAAQTNLSIDQVLQAQQRRAAFAAGTVPVSA